MRQIKFRVWDGKKYHYPEATKEESNHYLQFGAEGFWLFNENGNMVTATEVGGICEQFTCLKDRNGKEIYEGDILKDIHFDYTTKVVYEGNQFVSKSENGNVGLFETETYEIIGNIWEHENLLK